MLHIVNKSPFEKRTLDSCLRLMGENSVLILIEDGVYAVAKGNVLEAKIKRAIAATQVYALWPDLEARGMQDVVIDGVKLVDYGGFVDLVTEHSSVQSWL